MLKDRFPSAVPYKTTVDGGGHVVAKIQGKFWDIWGEHEPDRHGDVARFAAGEETYMSSCIFDEGYVLQNTDIIMKYDKGKT